jgi:predicted Zn-dependent peptidase
VGRETDAIGGQVNAFTSKELTSFYARSLDSDFGSASELLCDIFFNPRLDDADWETERGVILEEIDMYEDNPEDKVCEELYAACYPAQPLGRPVPGSAAALRDMSAAALRDFRASSYLSGGLVVSLCGRFSERHLRDVTERFSSVVCTQNPERAPAVYTPAITLTEKPIEQNHVCLAFPSLPSGHPARFSLQVLNGITGAGISSRLFQRVREQRGLCYSIYSFAAPHRDTGLFGVYMAAGRETEQTALRLTCEVLRELAAGGPDNAELERARGQIKANVLMGLESTYSVMHHIGQ